MGEVADAEGWGHSTSTEAFPGVRRRRRERPRRPFAAVEPVEHFHQRRDRPDVALGDELASSALNLAKANPRLRPLHLGGPGNGILRAETGGLFQAQNAGEQSEFGSQTTLRLTNPPELRGFLSTRKPPRFVGTAWWRTQSRQTGLRDRARLGNREKHTAMADNAFFWGSKTGQERELRQWFSLISQLRLNCNYCEILRKADALEHSSLQWVSRS